MGKPGRNDPCSCGSGRKYKACCLDSGGRRTAAAPASVQSGSPVPKAPERVRALYRAARFDDGDAEIRAALERPTTDADTLAALVVVANEARRLGVAVELLRRLAELMPGEVAILKSLGHALLQNGCVDEAIAVYERVVAQTPKDAFAHTDLGTALMARGRRRDAVTSFGRAVDATWGAAADVRASALYNLGLALQKDGALDEAVAALERAVALAPRYAAALDALGTAEYTRGQRAAAEARYREAIAADPKLASAHANLALTLNAMGRVVDAVAAADRALALDPRAVRAMVAAAMALGESGRIAEARARLEAALRLLPSSAHDRALANAHSTLLLFMSYDPATTEEERFTEHRLWYERYGAPLASAARRAHLRRAPHERTRIGYVSSNLRQHPVGFLMASVLAAHDRRRFEIFCYSTTKEDEWTARMKAHVDVWKTVEGLTDEDLAAAIGEDEIDILVDLNGHTGGHRLHTFAMKPAPVQVSAIGYFATTGMDTMDYVLMDEDTVPPSAERWFVEKVVRLPCSRFCYAPPTEAPPVAPPPVSRRGHVTFGSFNNLAKVTPEVVQLFARVLTAVPGSRMLLKWKTLEDPRVRDRFVALFQGNGIGAERLEIRGGSPHIAMLGEYGDVDIALDTFPFSGGMTTFEALWMGVPVITSPGVRAVSRQTHAIVKVLGLEELSCPDEDTYVSTAAALARDLPRLTALRDGLRRRMTESGLTSGETYTRHLEEAYLAM